MSRAQRRTSAADPVRDYLQALSPATQATMNRLRALTKAAHPYIAEHIKWNAPSFHINGEDRITLGLAPKGDVRVILHRGAKVKDSTGFGFNDSAKLAEWPEVDRGTMSFADEQAVIAVEPALTDLFRRWLATAA